MSNVKKVEIYFKDLTKEKKSEVMEASGVGWGETNNWDVIPLAVIEFEEDNNG